VFGNRRHGGCRPGRGRRHAGRVCNGYADGEAQYVAVRPVRPRRRARTDGDAEGDGQPVATASRRRPQPDGDREPDVFSDCHPDRDADAPSPSPTPTTWRSAISRSPRPAPGWERARTTLPPDRRCAWFADNGLSKIGRITTAGGASREYATPTETAVRSPSRSGPDNILVHRVQCGQDRQDNDRRRHTEYTRARSSGRGTSRRVRTVRCGSPTTRAAPSAGFPPPDGRHEYRCRAAERATIVSRTAIVAGSDGALWIHRLLGRDRPHDDGGDGDEIATHRLIRTGHHRARPDGALCTRSAPVRDRPHHDDGNQHVRPDAGNRRRSYSTASRSAATAHCGSRSTRARSAGSRPPASSPSVRRHGAGRSTSLPFGMTAGPDAAMWFTETKAGKIGPHRPEQRHRGPSPNRCTK